MRRTLSSLFIGAMVVISVFAVTGAFKSSANTEPKTWYVDDVPGSGPGNPDEDFTIIQDAIDSASQGDSVLVYSGIYYEHIVVNKALTLIGEDKANTIIDGEETWIVVFVKVGGAAISGFTIKNSGHVSYTGPLRECGIFLQNGDTTVSGNILDGNYIGIAVMSSNNSILNNEFKNNHHNDMFVHSNNIISGNTIETGYSIGIDCRGCNNLITENDFYSRYIGIYLQSAHNNIISGNYIQRLPGWGRAGMLLSASSQNSIHNNDIYDWNRPFEFHRSIENTIYHNNMIGNLYPPTDTHPFENNWHHPDLLEGNYWDDYMGLDDGSGSGKHAIANDGIGDTLIPHPQPGFDFYPFYKPDRWKKIEAAIDIDPDTLNVKSKGRWITCYIELPEGYDVRDIDASTILLEDSLSPILDPKFGFVKSEDSYIMDHDDDTILERMVKFDRDAVEEMLPPGIYNLKVTGEMTDGTVFEGYSDEIWVIDPP
ncbi:MAG: right-handed parallel beta-helix repeat-containing protein [Methanomassiliicoccales archaeon]|nr:MAG: right-handed parallel beta-helix repeat-containing protein [Methanomassiliicoccales archaeon]